MKYRLGIVGGGQLGRMLALEAKKMGFTVTVLDPTPASPAGQVSDEQIVADYKDEAAIRQLGEISDFLTFEIESANAEVLEELASKGLSINPSPGTLAIIKDKFRQKEFLRLNDIPVADFTAVTTAEDIQKAAEDFGYPLVLKARFDAYDGRGNAVIEDASEIPAAMEKLAGRLLYVEKWAPFVKELSVVVARNARGEIAAYPVVETVHKNNICHTVFSPARVNEETAVKAESLSVRVMECLQGAGVFGIEMFLTSTGQVLINEIAPRVHNSGHHTIEAAATSQFEQHVRAVTGLPLGPTNLTVPAAVMINILGERQAPAQVDGLHKALALPGVAVHIYGKAETKPERKMGHITAIAETLEEALNKAETARKHITI